MLPARKRSRIWAGGAAKAKWVMTNKGSEEHQEQYCRRVAKEFWYGARLDELFAGTHPKG